MAITQTAQAQACPGIGATCAGGPGSVTITINQEGLAPINKTSSGALEIDCCNSSHISGKASCGCELTSLAPFDLFPIGFVCLAPGSEVCDLGEVDCDGGNALGVELWDDHNIGPCATWDECEGRCRDECPTDGHVYVDHSCEGFCTIGSCAVGGADCEDRDDCAGGACVTNACSNDADCLPGGASCAGAGDPVGGCGSCDGRAFCSVSGTACDGDVDCPATETCDGPSHPATCNCICATWGAGDPSPPGGLACEISTAITVEAASPCDGTDVTIGVGDQCIGLTTELATVTMMDVNNGTGTAGPFTTGGAPADCAALAAGSASGISLGGVSSFFDSTLGDLAVQTTFACPPGG